MNKEEYLRKLSKELVFLTKDEYAKEIDCYKKYFDADHAKKISIEKTIESLGSPKELSKKIYLKRGIDSSKLKRNFINNIINSVTDVVNAFKNKKNDKKKMIIDLIYIFLLIILIKLPFNLVRDIGLSYIKIITPGSIYDVLWSLLFLLIYTITSLCVFIVLIRNFGKKYIN